MAFREVHMIELQEVLRLWIRGRGLRAISQASLVDRKTVRRYVEAAEDLGLVQNGDEGQVTDAIFGQLLDLVRPSGPGVHGESWELCQVHRKFLQERLDQGLRLTKVQQLLLRHTGHDVPYSTLRRFAKEELGHKKMKTTVRVAECLPGQELQVDFGHMGRVDWGGTCRELHALIFTSVYSRHSFVWLTHSQTIEAVVEGFEEAWRFFGGVFHVVIPDNCKAMVAHADANDARLTIEFLEYSKHRGFEVDPCRVRRPQDKPRVERTVPYVRESFFEGEEFVDLAEARRRAAAWCLAEAGDRIHGTTRQHPREVFESEEKDLLKSVPTDRYDIARWVETTVGKDQHAQVECALYSLPLEFVNQTVRARVDTKLVRFYHKDRLVKTHARMQRGQRATDAKDYPPEVRAYAMRDTALLQDKASSHGEHVGAYARRLLEGPLPWTRMRHIYRLLGLVQRFGAQRVNEACQRALELDVVDVNRVARMLALALETHKSVPPLRAKPSSLPLRFERAASEFTVQRAANTQQEENEDGLI